jgi:hypothetical protein
VLSILLPLALWRSGPMTPLHWIGLLFIAYAAVRVFYAPLFADSVYGLWLVCIMALSFWLGSTMDDLRKLYAGLAVGASVSSMVAVFQYFGVSVVPYVTPTPAGLYVNSVVQGTVLALIVVALVSERMWLWVPLPILGIALSGSRGAWLALAAGLLAAYVRRAWVFVILGAAGLLLLMQPLSSSDVLRLTIWTAAVHNFTWLGWGPGSFFSWLLWYDNNSIYPEYAHNDALQLVFEYGIAAVLPFSIFAFVLTRNSDRMWPVIVAFVTAGCYSMPLYMPVASFIGLVTAGRIVRSWALVRRERNSRRFDFVPREHRYAAQPGSTDIPMVARS